MKDWDMVFTWRESGMTTDRLQLLLREAGLPFDFSEESCKKINSWIANPMSAIEREREVQ